MASGLTNKILKTVGLFSGLEFLLILCGIVKMKLVALWLGTVGVGLFGIFNSTIDTASTLTGLGLRQSAVRDVAQARNSPGRVSLISALVTRWSMLAGMLGAFVTLALSPVLARWFFHSASMWWQFALLASVLLFNSLADGQKAILQGVGELKPLARASLIATLGALAVTVPLYRYCGDVSVIISVVIYSLFGVCAVLYHRFRAPEKVKVTREEMRKSSGFVKLGAYMATAAFVTSLAQMVFLGWLNDTASTSEVGLYQSGSVIILRYVGTIFIAVSMEYYPRLSANISSNRRTSLFVSHEISLLLTLLIPFILVFLTVREPIVQILYSSEFFPIIPFITLAILGTILRTVSTCVAFTVLAKGDGRIYTVTESVDAAIGLGLNILCYSLWGLTGLGIAYILWYLIYTLMVGGIYLLRYRLRISRAAWMNIGVGVCAAGAGFWAIETLPYPLAAVLLSLLALCYFPAVLKLLASRRKRKALRP